MFEKVKKGKKGKGGKGKKGAKKPKGGKVKKWCPAVNTCCNNPTEREDCVPYLVQLGILKKIKPCHLEDFLGEYHYLGAMQRVIPSPRTSIPYCPAPSAQMTRSLIVEHCVLPLAATDIRQKAPESLTARSLLLYGPKGSGKSMLARAIATETGSTFFDLSPAVIEGKSTAGKIGSDLLVYKVFICAQDMAPSVIYIDQIDQVFTGGKKKKGGDANAPSRIKKDLCAAMQQVKRGHESTEQDRILFIGCTSKPFDEGVDQKDLIAKFDEKVWLSFPDYGSRVLLWKNFIEAKGVRVDPSKLDTSSLAHVSEGYSAGAFKQTVDRVLTERRVQQIKHRPLEAQEFLGPLSRTPFCWPEDFKQFREFDHEATGERQRLAAMQADTERLEGDQKGG